MYAVAFVLNFVACCLFSLAFLRRHYDKPRTEPVFRESIVVAVLLFSVEAWVFAEGLSAMNALKTPEPMFVLYLLSLLGLVAGIWYLRDSLIQAVHDLRETPWDPFAVKMSFAIGGLIILPLACVAVYYPPCTADSMSYHLTRIVHWIQNGNVGMYPTNYPRQLYYQPFAEYLMLPWQLLTGTDFFDNTVQVVALVIMLLLLSLLVRFFGGDALCQCWAATLALSSPIVIFEASTTQTDIILTALYFSFLYFGFKLSRKQPTHPKTIWWLLVVCFAVSLGLSLNTKLSIGAFEIPFCIWFGLRLFALYGRKVWPVFGSLVVGFLVFNAPYFHRNAEISGSIFGPAEIQEKMRNLRFGIGPTFSNALRNVTMQLRIPNRQVNERNREIIIAIHDALGMSIHDTTTTYAGDGTVAYEYETVFILDDYRSGNILIILLFGITVVALTARTIQGIGTPPLAEPTTDSSLPKNKRKGKKGTAGVDRSETDAPMIPELSLRLFAWLMVFGFLIYSSLFRWQPFGARLLLPCFIGVIPFIVVGLKQVLPRMRIVLFTVLLLAGAVLYTVFSLSTTMFFDPTVALLRVEESPVTDDQVDEPIRPSPYPHINIWDARTTLAATNVSDESTQEKNPDRTQSTTNTTEQIVNRHVSIRGAELLSDHFTPKETRWKSYLFRRNYQYFRTIHSYLLDYLSIAERIDELGYTNIGVAFDRWHDRWEYPFWPLLRSKGKKYRIEWEIYPDYLQKAVNYDPNFTPELLITDWPPHVVEKYFVIGRAWKYDHMVLLEIKGRKKGFPPPP